MSDTARMTVFLDRDGTINQEKHHLSNPDDLELLPGAVAGLRTLKRHGFLLVVVTNQSPIGRGLFDEKRLAEIHDRLAKLLRDEQVEIDGWYYCPHLPDEGCQCRKPEAGLLRQAQHDLGIDFDTSWIVGDKLSDVQAGRRAGVRTILVATGYGQQQNNLPESAECVDYFVPSLVEAAEAIVQDIPSHQNANQ